MKFERKMSKSFKRDNETDPEYFGIDHDIRKINIEASENKELY